MNGILIGPRDSGKASFLGSLSRSMVLRKNIQEEFIGANQAMGDLTPVMTRWLETGTLDFSNHSHAREDTVFQFMLDTAEPSMFEGIQFWKEDDNASSCLSVHHPKDTNTLFAESTVNHLKKSEYCIICDSIKHIDQPQRQNNHFEHLAHLFLQMYSLDCSVKRVAIVITNAQNDQEQLPVDIALRVIGKRFFEVFKTFCPVDVRFDFFLVDAFTVSEGAVHPYTLDQWQPKSTIEPMLFCLKGTESKHALSLKEVEVKCKI